MKEQLKVFISETYDPWFNLATEDWIFRDMDPNCKLLFLWRNQNTVVIGRFQNAWKECNTRKMDADNIFLARRQSGGGAVFHDLGNTNFTFLNSKSSFNKAINNQIILNALSQFNIVAKASGRNDLVIESDEGEKKFSGSAFKDTRDRAFHHGTLLINADLSKLANYLNPDPKKLVSKGIASVRSRVVNLQELNPHITHDSLSQALIKSFFDYYQSECPVEILDHQYLKQIPALDLYYQKLKDWNWRFGESPDFTHELSERFSWGNVDIHLDVEKGKIVKCQIYSDSLFPDLIELLMDELNGCFYNKESISFVLKEMRIKLPNYIDFLNELENWMIVQIC